MSTQRVVSGPKVIDAVFRATLKVQTKRLRTALTGAPLVYLAGDAFAEEFMRERAAHGIHIQSLRFSASKNLDQPQHANDATLDKAVRTAPPGITIASSLVLWDDVVVSITTEPEIQAIWIDDVAFATTMNAWFEFVWNQSSR